MVEYRSDLFKGTAEYYDRFRLPYPTALFDDLRNRVSLSERARVVDLACGTGQIAFPLATHVSEILAVDQEEESIAFGRAKADALGVTNIRWVVSAAEDVALEGAFDLVAIGNAFHRLERGVVVERLLPHLPDGACVALLWGGTPWRGERPWQRTLFETLERWRDTAGVRDRVPQGWEDAIDRDPHENVFRRAGLTYEGEFRFAVDAQWTVESLAGFVYSTSFLNRQALGDKVSDFERDLRRVIGDEVVEAEMGFAYQLARKARR